MLGRAPSAADVAAAANIAARLGFETTALDLLIRAGAEGAEGAEQREGVAIAVGAGSLKRLGIPPATPGVVLEPGEGTVAVLDTGVWIKVRRERPSAGRRVGG